jgi:hypothetical protein
MSLNWPNKFVEEVLDYQLDWTARLDGDVIQSSEAVSPAGVTVASQSFEGALQTVWLSGGSTGNPSQIRLTITTAAGRTMEEIVTIRCN